MTRVCGQCRVAGRETILGEKCPQCGAEAKEFYTGTEVWFECASRECPGRGTGEIKFIFPRGEGGITAGLCEPCLAEVRNESTAPAGSTPLDSRN